MAAVSMPILVVDDFDPWRRSHCSYLQENTAWQIVCEVSEGLEAVELQPDVVWLDIGLPTLNGIEAAKQIREVSPAARSLLRQNTCPAVIQGSLRVGGCGQVVR